MIVLGADMHKRSHTLAAVAASTGELLGDTTIAVGDRGFIAALEWAAGLGEDRVWALQDCRHVSGASERFRSSTCSFRVEEQRSTPCASAASSHAGVYRRSSAATADGAAATVPARAISP